MNNEKFEKLMQDEEFVKRIVKMQTPEDVQSEFKKEGVELSLEEIGALGSAINKSLEKHGQPLTEDELSDIAGGGIRDYFAGRDLGEERWDWGYVYNGKRIYPSDMERIRGEHARKRVGIVAGIAGALGGIVGGLAIGAGGVGAAWAWADNANDANNKSDAPVNKNLKEY